MTLMIWFCHQWCTLICSKNEEIISSFFINCRVIGTNTCQGITSRNYRLGLSLSIIGMHSGTTPNAITSGCLITRIQNWSACPGHFKSKIGFFWQFSIKIYQDYAYHLEIDWFGCPVLSSGILLILWVMHCS